MGDALTLTDLLVGALALFVTGSVISLPLSMSAVLVVGAREIGISMGRHYQREALRGGWRHQVGMVVPIIGVLVVLLLAIAGGIASYFPSPVRYSPPVNVSSQADWTFYV